MTGKLFIVATPIGNLADFTFRAVETLKTVDFILCEDTRTTGKLLSHYEISNKLVSFNAQSEDGKSKIVLEKLLQGESGALVSDAGTPTISDPGVRLVSFLLENNIQVVGIPGANAAILALSVSGIPTDSFAYEGFLPQKKGRQKILKELVLEKRTIVLYESVHRIEKLISELNEYMPERFVVIQRELTKSFEECWKGLPGEIIIGLSQKIIKGEFVVIIAPIGWKIN
ncbi:MAG: 16S rRNA (cytidine(1402)-2'-O)-methyltransferase [Melioribacteraceae bacterium]|nr:16S rRNA (cytidine(1402)-2'-O)-methyltransferase [Melioribacteraceae bacterium]